MRTPAVVRVSPREVLEAAPLGVCAVAAGGRLLAANPALERVAGAWPRGPGPRTLADLVHGDDAGAVGRALERLAAGEAGPLAVEARCRRADGSVFWGRLTLSTAREAAGGTRFHVVTMEDVGDRRRLDAAMEGLNQRLEELNRAKSGLVASVSHEFRTALTVIEGFSELLRDEDLGAEEARELAADVNAEARRLGRLIDDLLDLDRMESGAVPLRPRAVDLNRLLATLVDRARRGGPGRRLELRPGEGLPAVRADPDRLTQVVSNLLSNAIKYSPPGSTIEVRSEAAAGGVRLAVRDRGPGIPEDALERVFDPYTRLQPAGAAVAGAGLGLQIVRQIVRMHGGRVWAGNRPGGGAVFTVELPAGSEPEESGAGPVL